MLTLWNVQHMPRQAYKPPPLPPGREGEGTLYNMGSRNFQKLKAL